MAYHKYDSYEAIIKLVKSKKLKEPFFPADIAKATRAKNAGTLRRYPTRHRKGNPDGYSVLFTKLKDGRYKLVRPFKFGIK